MRDADASAGQASSGVSRNVPLCPIGENALNERQVAAMELMVAGKTDAAIARTLEVDRRTLYRWRTGHEAFRRELDRRRRAMWDGASDRLRAMLDPALDVLETQLADRYD